VDRLKWLLEWAETHLYEVLAALLPGAVGIVLASDWARSLGLSFRLPGTEIAWFVTAYVTGLGLQGLGAAVASVRSPLRLRPRRKDFPDQVLIDCARAHLAKLAGIDEAKLETRDVFNLAYSMLGDKAARYDRFLTLSDLSRSLMLLSAVSVGAFLYAAAAPSGVHLVLRVPGPSTAKALLALVAFLAFWNRRRRYREVSQRLIYPMLIAHCSGEAGTHPGVPPKSP
jgi:hypothetical protein